VLCCWGMRTFVTAPLAIANLIFAARVPRKHVGGLYLKLAGHALPSDEREAKGYVGQALRHALIDEERRRTRNPVAPWDPLSGLSNALAANPIRPDDLERQKTLRALLQTGIALLPPHQRSLVRAWMERSDRNNMTAIHGALPQPCRYGAYHCKNRAIARLTRIVSGLAVASGNPDLCPDAPGKQPRRGQGSRAREKTAAFSKNPAGVRSERGEGNP
jgi:hypothetical protein